MITICEIKPEVQEFLDAHCNIGCVGGVKWYELNGNDYIETKAINIFIVQNNN